MRERHFSNTYIEARQRFLVAADNVGANVTSYPIKGASTVELAIDVATIGAEGAPTIIISSGAHGAEGFLGSAVQDALLEQLDSEARERNVRYVLIHALNPYGFANLRRVNEDNVDLNRNFLLAGEPYEGAAAGYDKLNRLLNPSSPPPFFDPFRLKAAWNIWRHGLQTLKQSVAGGQYEFPEGLFFGGHGPCQSTQVVFEHCADWIGASEQVIHIDFHTGLGSYGAYKLLLAEAAGSASCAWYNEVFGENLVECQDAPESTAYKISGMLGEWVRNHFSEVDYRYAAAEFGTYGVIRVLQALRAENRAHFHADPDSPVYHAAKAEFLECFCPRDEGWRNQVLESGLSIIAQAERALSAETTNPQ